MTQVLERIAELIRPDVVTDEIYVTVLPRHIAVGKPYGNECPVYLALKEDGRDVHWVTTAGVHTGSFKLIYRGDYEFSRWIRAFDRGELVAPERFRLTRC